MKKPIAFQLRFRLVQDFNLAPSVVARRALACSVLETARDFPFLGFGWADSHGHALTMAEGANELARRIEIGLQARLRPGVPFQPAYLEPIFDMWHLRNTLLYVLRQDVRHGFVHDPWHDASSLPDLLGARVVGDWIMRNVREQLPRLTRKDVLEAVGLPDPELAAWDDTDLADAASAALGLPDLAGRSADTLAARTAAVHVARDRLSLPDVAARLGVDVRTVQRLALKPTDRSVVRAVRQQLGLRATIAAPQPTESPEPAFA